MSYTASILQSFLFRRHLDDEETILSVVHKHWLLGTKMLFWPTLFLLVSWVVPVFNRAPGMLLVLGLWNVVFAVWWLRNFFDYYLDAWVITDQGIIDIAWHGWFHRESTRVLYSDLQGISYEIQGVMGTMLRYGNISVEKISTGSSMTLENVPRPKRVESMVLRSQESYLHSKNLQDATQVQSLLSTLVARHMLMQEKGIDAEEDASDTDSDEDDA